MTEPIDDSAPSTPLLSSSRPLARAYDVALLDLDGVCFAGEARIPHAAEGANGARALGMGLSFITNNASRAPQTVVDKLAANGIEALAREVFTAAMDAAALLRERLEPGARVLVVGGDGVRRALTDEGFTVVDSADQDPAAVVQGWDPAVDWAMMSEGAYALTGQPMRHDHRRVLATALSRLRAKIKYRPVIFELMPPEFTLLQLQNSVEAISGRLLHKQNFRRQIQQQNLIEPSDTGVSGSKGRPAQLYRFRDDVLPDRLISDIGLPLGSR